MELGVVLSQLPVTNEELPVHHVAIKNGQVTLDRKSVTRHHYVITNKSEKETEFLLEHPKQSYPATTTLVVEECYNGTETTKNKIDLRTEYPFKYIITFNFLIFLIF
jgi:hypothetical protein